MRAFFGQTQPLPEKNIINLIDVCLNIFVCCIVWFLCMYCEIHLEFKILRSIIVILGHTSNYYNCNKIEAIPLTHFQTIMFRPHVALLCQEPQQVWWVCWFCIISYLSDSIVFLQDLASHNLRPHQLTDSHIRTSPFSATGRGRLTFWLLCIICTRSARHQTLLPYESMFVYVYLYRSTKIHSI